MSSSPSWTEVTSRRQHRTNNFRPSNDYVPPHLRKPSFAPESVNRFIPESYPPVTRPSPSLPSRGRGSYNNQNRTTFSEPNPFNNLTDNFNRLSVQNTPFTDGQNTPATCIDFEACEEIEVKSTGDNIPAPVNTFSEINLGKAVNDNIDRCKYVKPTPIQKHAIPIVVAGRDLMACAQTGSGKTAAFCFPIIAGILNKKRSMSAKEMYAPLRGGGYESRIAFPTALILSPTRELACQIHDEAKKFSYMTGLKIVVMYGGAPVYEQLRNLERGVDILVATPGRLADMIERNRVSMSKIKYLILDEADRMLDMGFEPQIRKLVEQLDMPKTGVRQTLLFSATFPSEIQRLASDFLSNYIFLSVGRVGSSTEKIAQKVELVEDSDKQNHLVKILKGERENGSHGKHALMVVFVETKRAADILEQHLIRNGFPATAIHGDKVQMERERALKLFKSGVKPILVATDVAARGLDISNISHVVNYDLPKSIDNYVHRIGRTGRAGKSGMATAFFNQGNASLAKSLVELMQETKQEVPAFLIQYSEDSSSYYGGRNKFGGRDYRSNYNSTLSVDAAAYVPATAYGAPADYGSTEYAPPADYGSTEYVPPADYEADRSFEYPVDLGGMESTGWD